MANSSPAVLSVRVSPAERILLETAAEQARTTIIPAKTGIRTPTGSTSSCRTDQYWPSLASFCPMIA